MIIRFFLLILGLSFLRQAIAAPEKHILDGVTYQVLRAPSQSVKILWKDAAGNPMRTFPEVAQYCEREKIAVETLMNGGIFELGGVPSGLLIQDGKMLRPVNPRDGEGNFFLKPNGIFLIGSKGAAVIPTADYPLPGVEIQYAVQSGPMLLCRGKIHSAFNEHSTSRLHRNGVGVSKDGQIVLVMTDFHSPKFPNLWEFADVFRKLGCEDALFLDGDLSQMRSGAEIKKQSNSFGSIIVVTEVRKTAQNSRGQPATQSESN